MGGNYGGADCVHVEEVPRELRGAMMYGIALMDSTDVIVWDEHGNVCQFTYQEWNDFVRKVRSDDIGFMGHEPEDIVPDPINRRLMDEALAWREGDPTIVTPASRIGPSGERHVEAWERHPDDDFSDAIKRIDRRSGPLDLFDQSPGRIVWDSGQGNYGCRTCESSDGCAECRAPNDPDPFDQPPSRPLPAHLDYDSIYRGDV